MKYALLLVLIPLFVNCGNNKDEKDQRSEQAEENIKPIKKTAPVQEATYYLIRHAEKDRSNEYDKDPNLTVEGMLHAKRWAAYFEPIQLDAIYATRFLRTRQTVSLIAQQKMITIKPYKAGHLYSEDFLALTNHKHVLIVGHSNTIPKLVNALIGEDKYEDMDDSDNATLYKVTLNGDDKKVETFTVK
jgi:phosphohistidine phosphatase SixA